MEYLYERLAGYGQSKFYPFHMPGHKRRMGAKGFVDPFLFDITEIEGFDNLHHSQGILKEAQERAAGIYKAEKTYFLINGTTCGLLAAISACTEKGGRILMTRNCHKAVYHGVFLNELENIYTYPHKSMEECVNCGLNSESVKQLLNKYQNIQAIIITSPTYDGIVSDVEEIVKEAHSRCIPVIVDEAHGAHFGFHPYFPESSVHKGADIVVHSVHKTLPSLTQTALLHAGGELVDMERLEKYLGIYQTSSPSYVLMASIDHCIKLLLENGEKLFAAYVKELDWLRKELLTLQHIKLLDESLLRERGVADLDRSKLILSVENADITGNELYRVLHDKYYLEMEMVTDRYVLGMTSVMDDRTGYERLASALKEIDQGLSRKEKIRRPGMWHEARQRMTIAEAEKRKKTAALLQDSIGKTAGEYVYLYPPGIPLIVPGEKIDRDFIEEILYDRGAGLSIEGMRDKTGATIQVLAE